MPIEFIAEERRIAMAEVKVSVVIPVYKVEKYLEQCVDSVLNQNYPSIEVILVDDGSPDRCPQICEEYAKNYECVKVIHKENGGLSSARNCGMQAATGKYIMFLDSDDWWNENIKLEKLIQKVEEVQDAEMTCFCALNYIQQQGLVLRHDASFYEHEKGILTKEQYYQKVVKQGNLQETAYTKIFSKQFLMDNKLLFQEGLLGEDTEWMFRVLRKANRVLIMNEPLVVYRYGREGAITNTISIKNVMDILVVISQSVDYYKYKSGDNLRKYELAHCAYLWFVALSMFAKLPGTEKKQCEATLKKYVFLSEYAVSAKARLSKRVLKIIGLRGTAFVLSMYVELGRKNIIKKGRKI